MESRAVADLDFLVFKSSLQVFGDGLFSQRNCLKDRVITCVLIGSHISCFGDSLIQILQHFIGIVCIAWIGAEADLGRAEAVGVFHFPHMIKLF